MSSSQQHRNIARSLEEISLDEPRRQICKCLESDGSELQRRPTYGPAFAMGENKFCKKLKDEVWSQVIDTTLGTELGVRNRYISAVRSIESEARATYADAVMENFPGNEFIRIMVIDTCFFLQLLLYYFGAQLGYPPEHPVFGSERDQNVLRMWLESMFIVGNQIPLSVIEKVMSQSFFQQAIARTTRWKQPLGLLEEALYEVLLVPAVNNHHQHQQRTIGSNLFQGLVEKPCDLLHGLYLIVLGTKNDPIDENEREKVYSAMGLTEDNANDEQRFPTASELSRAGIGFRGVDGMGSRGIYFNEGLLYLPSFMVDDSFKLLFQCLKTYETTQQLMKHEASSHLRFLSDLVRTIEDAKILASHGVIKGEVEKFPELVIMSGLAGRDTSLSRNICEVRLQINDYSRQGIGGL